MDDFSKAYQSIDVLNKGVAFCDSEKKDLEEEIKNIAKRVKERDDSIDGNVQTFFKDFISNCKKESPEDRLVFKAKWNKCSKEGEERVDYIINEMRGELIGKISMLRESKLQKEFDRFVKKMGLDPSNERLIEAKNDMKSRNKFITIGREDFLCDGMVKRFFSKYTWENCSDI